MRLHDIFLIESFDDIKAQRALLNVIKRGAEAYRDGRGRGAKAAYDAVQKTLQLTKVE